MPGSIPSIRTEFDALRSGAAPLPLLHPEVTDINDSSGIKPIGYLSDGKLYGSNIAADELHVSEDEGSTWTKHCDVATGTGLIRQIFELDNGEVIVQKAKNLVESTNWSSGSPTWTSVLTSSTVDGGDTFSFNDYSCDYQNGVFLATEYGNPWETQSSSIKVSLRTSDAGSFSTIAETGVTAEFPTTETHLHGSCLTRDGSRAIVLFGHGTEKGAWSTLTASISWAKIPNTQHELSRTGSDYSAWLGLTATKDSILLMSDDNPSGIGYIDTTKSFADWEIEVIYVEKQGIAGLLFFGNRAVYDEKRDIAYLGINVRLADGLPLTLYGVSGKQVRPVWQWDQTPAQSQVIRTICVNPTSGDLTCLIDDASNDFRQLNAEYSGVGTPNLQPWEFGYVQIGGYSDAALINSVVLAIGPDSFVGEEFGYASGPGANAGGKRSSVKGTLATDGDYDDCVVDGYRAEAYGIRAIPIGTDTSANARTVVIGDYTDGSAVLSGVSVGDGNTLNGNNLVVVGRNCEGGLQSTGAGTNGFAAPRSGFFGYSCKSRGDQQYTIGLNIDWTEDDALIFGTVNTNGDAPLFGLIGASSSGDQRKTADISTEWADSTDATRKGRVIFNVWDTAAREAMRAETDGSRAYVIQKVHSTAPADSMLSNGSVAFYDDGSGNLAIKLKDSGGTVRTGTVSLT